MTRQARYKLRKPWVRYVEWARRRCKATDPHHRPNYLDKGVVCTLDAAQAEILWKRDGAASMKKPTLDRILSRNGEPYSFENCRFVEHIFNSMRALHPDIVEEEDLPAWVTEE